MENSVRAIEIKNFKGIKEIKIDKIDSGKSVFYLYGKNGTGKTSFIHAVGYGLTGKCPGKPLRNGTEEGYVKVVFSDAENTEVCRYFNGDKLKPNKVTVNGKATTGESATNVICRILCPTITNEQLDLLTHPDAFNELMASGNMASFLFSLIPEKLSLETIAGFSEYSEKEFEVLDEFFSSKDEITLDDCKAFYNEVFARRRAEKRILQELQAKCKGEGEVELPPHIKNEVDLKFYTKAFYSYEEASSAYKTALEKYNADVKKYEAALKNIAEMEHRAADIGKVDESTVSLDALQDEYNKLSESIAKLSANADTHRKTIEKLSVPGCPLGAGITCLANREEISKSLEKEISSLVSEIETLKKERDAVQSKLLIVRNNEKKSGELKIIEAKINGIKETLNEPVKPVFSKESEKLDFDFEAEEKAYKTFEELQNNIKLRNSQQEIVEGLSALCDKFSAKGEVTDKIINYYVDILDDYALEISKKFGYEVSFVADEGLKIMVAPGTDRDFVEFKVLSRGETLIATAIVYHMINRLLGCGIMVIDNYNDLDDDKFKTVSAVLDEISEEYSLIVIAGTNVESLMDRAI